MKRIGILSVVIVCNCLLLRAQDFQKSMRELQDKYKEMTAMRVAMEVSVFENVNSKVPHYSLNVDIKKDGENYLYRFGNGEMLMNDKYLIVVDKNNKEIVYSDRNVKAEQEMRKNFKFDLDSILTLYNDAKYRGKVDQVHHYQLAEKSGDITSTELFVHEGSGLLQRICYVYSSGQYVVINFKEFEINPHFQENSFDEQSYVVNQKSKMTPASAFKGYNITKAN